MSRQADKPTFKPVNPEFDSVIRASFARQGLMGAIGAWLVTVEPGHVVIELPFSERIGQQHGFFHGGVIGAIADNACGYAALSLQPAGSEVLTVEYKINFLRPAQGQLLRASGEVVRAGKSISVVRAEVTSGAEGHRAVCAIMQATMMRTGGA